MKRFQKESFKLFTITIFALSLAFIGCDWQSGINATDGEYENKILISWDELVVSIGGSSSTPLFYNVFRADSEDGDYTTKIGGDIEILYVADETVVPGVHYFYKVKAVFSDGSSAYSKSDEGYAFCPKKVYNLNNGNYMIYDSADLDALSGYTEVTGNLKIRDTTLTNLDGLQCLTTVGGALYIWNNEALTDISGLSSITSVGGNSNILDGILYISDNPVLPDINGLSNLNSVGDALFIQYNASLTDLNGLSNLNSIGEWLTIQYNNELTDISGLILVSNGGKGALTFIGGGSAIEGNEKLCSSDVTKFFEQPGLTIEGDAFQNGNKICP